MWPISILTLPINMSERVIKGKHNSSWNQKKTTQGQRPDAENIHNNKKITIISKGWEIFLRPIMIKKGLY